MCFWSPSTPTKAGREPGERRRLPEDQALGRLRDAGALERGLGKGRGVHRERESKRHTDTA